MHGNKDRQSFHLWLELYEKMQRWSPRWKDYATNRSLLKKMGRYSIFGS